MATFTNVTPNPLTADGKLNKKYSNSKYATSDFSGIENTAYLKKDINTAVIMNQYLADNLYMPGIGELGAAMENIEKINNGVTRYGGTNRISENKNYASSTLCTFPESNGNKNYEKSRNLISYVWYYNTSYAEIAYGQIIDNYGALGFYRYIPETDESFEEKELSNEYDYTLVVEEKEPTELKFNSSNYQNNTYIFNFKSNFAKKDAQGQEYNQLISYNFYSNNDEVLWPGLINPMDLSPISIPENSYLFGPNGSDRIFILPENFNENPGTGIIAYITEYLNENQSAKEITGTEGPFEFKFKGDRTREACSAKASINYTIKILERPLVDPNLQPSMSTILIDEPYQGSNGIFDRRIEEIINSIVHHNPNGEDTPLNDSEKNKLKNKENWDYNGNKSIIDQLSGNNVNVYFNNPPNQTFSFYLKYKGNEEDLGFNEQSLKVEVKINIQAPTVKTNIEIYFVNDDHEKITEKTYNNSATHLYAIPRIENNKNVSGLNIIPEYNGQGAEIRSDNNGWYNLFTETHGNFSIEATFNGNDEYNESFADPCVLKIKSTSGSTTNPSIDPTLRYATAAVKTVKNSSNLYDIPNLTVEPTSLKYSETSSRSTDGATITSDHKLKYSFDFSNNEDYRLVKITAVSGDQKIGNTQYNNMSTSCQISIYKQQKQSSSITLSSTADVIITKEMTLTEAQKLLPTIKSTNPSGLPIRYSSSNPEIVDIDLQTGKLKFTVGSNSEYITMSNNGETTITVTGITYTDSNGIPYDSCTTQYKIIVRITGNVLENLTNNFKNHILYFQGDNASLSTWIKNNTTVSIYDILNNPNKFMYTIWPNPIYINSFGLNSRWAKSSGTTDYQSPNIIFMVPSYISEWYSSFDNMKNNLTIKIKFGQLSTFTMTLAGQIKDTLVYSLFLDAKNFGFLKNSTDIITISLYKKSSDKTASLEKNYFYNPYSLRVTQPTNIQLNTEVNFGNYYSLGWHQTTGSTGYRFNNMTNMPTKITVMDNNGERNSYINTYFSGTSGSTYLGALRVDRFAYHVTNANNPASYSGVQRIKINSKDNNIHGLSLSIKQDNIKNGNNNDFSNSHIVLRSFFNRDRFGIFNDCILNDLNPNYVLDTNLSKTDLTTYAITANTSTGSTVKKIATGTTFTYYTYYTTTLNYTTKSNTYISKLTYTYYAPRDNNNSATRIYSVEAMIKNLPITGVKQILYNDFTDRFTDGQYNHSGLYYLPKNSDVLPLNKFTDYLFIHNDSDTKSKIIFTDKSDALAVGSRTITLEPHETLEYFPNVRDKLPIVVTFARTTSDDKTLNKNKIFEYYQFKDLHYLDDDEPILVDGIDQFDNELSIDRIYKYNCAMNYIYQYFNSESKLILRKYGTNEIYKLLNIPTRIVEDPDISNALIDEFGRNHGILSATVKFAIQNNQGRGERVKRQTYNNDVTKETINRYPVYTTDRYLGGALILITKDRSIDMKCKLYVSDNLSYSITRYGDEPEPYLYMVNVTISWGNATIGEYSTVNDWNGTPGNTTNILANHAIFTGYANLNPPNTYPGGQAKFTGDLLKNENNIEGMGNYERSIYAMVQCGFMYSDGYGIKYSHRFESNNKVAFTKDNLFDYLKSIRVSIGGSFIYNSGNTTYNPDIQIDWNGTL